MALSITAVIMTASLIAPQTGQSSSQQTISSNGTSTSKHRFNWLYTTRSLFSHTSMLSTESAWCENLIPHALKQFVIVFVVTFSLHLWIHRTARNKSMYSYLPSSMSSTVFFTISRRYKYLKFLITPRSRGCNLDVSFGGKTWILMWDREGRLVCAGELSINMINFLFFIFIRRINFSCESVNNA